MDSKNKKILNLITILMAVDSCIWAVVLVYLTFYNKNPVIYMLPFIFVITKSIIFSYIHELKKPRNN